MATIQSTLSLNDRMSSTLSNIVKAMNSTLKAMQKIEGQDFGKEFRNASKYIKLANNDLKGFKSSSDKAGSSFGSIFKGILGASAVQSILGMISNQLDSAISRMDTLNNYTNVMRNLGISENAAAASRERLSAGLEGLPTTLDSAVSAVQRFTSANNDVAASTEYYLAMNNAILAGGTAIVNQEAAMEQLAQAYSKGKFEMEEWKSLQVAMPGQLKQIAQAMNMTSTELYNSILEGRTSMDEFLQTAVRLNQEGANGFASFTEQAKGATSGMNTAIANMRTAVTKGLVSVMESINEGLESAGLGSIQTIITNIGKGLQTMLTSIGSLIQRIIVVMTPFINLIRNIATFIQSNWSIIKPILIGIASALLIYYTYTLIAAAGTAILQTAVAALTNPMFWVVLAIAAIIAALVYLWNTNDTVAYWMLFAWDALRLGLMLLKLGAQEAFYGIILAGLYMYEGILGIKLGLQTAFYAMIIGAQTLYLGFQGVCEGIVNAFIWMYNQVVSLLNSLGASFSTMNYADFTSGTVNAISKTLGDYASATASTYGDIAENTAKISELQDKMATIAYEGATNIQNTAANYNATRNDRVASRNQLGSGLSSAINKAMDKVTSSFNNVNDLNNLADSVTGTDGTGSKAVQTTTNDDLISDEDIQLLLDVATRDYKLNYQQVTPSITLTFGDVHETADVDGIIDEVANKLEEIYDGNLEVG